MANGPSTNPEGDLVECPRCGRLTDRIPVVVNRIDWASMFFVGIGALLFPSARSSELQCRECGRTFRTKAYEMTRGDRIIRGIFLTLMLVIVVPILLFLWVSFFSGS